MSKLRSETGALIREDFLEDIEKAFPAEAVQPNLTTMDMVMYNAGQRAVVEWIKAKTK